MNDCILEWKLFEKTKTEKLFFIHEKLFRYNEEYIVPVSYLNKYPSLISFANITIPTIVGKPKLIYKFSLPKRIVKKIKKYPTNITGISFENGINAVFQAEKQNNLAFLSKNKSYLEYIGSLECNITEIPIREEDDGTIKSLDPNFNDYIKGVNEVTKIMVKNLAPLFSFIKKEIFSSDRVLSQELSISPDRKVLAL